MTQDELNKLVASPVGSLEIVENPTDGWLTYYDGDGKLKRVAISEFQALLGNVAKPLSTTDPSPTAEGWYKPMAAGTYANAGGLVAQEGYDTLFYFDGTSTWKKVEVEMPSAVDTVTSGGTTPVNSKAVIDYAEPLRFYPFANKPISTIQQKVSRAVKELYILNYDTDYDYYLVGLYRKKNFSGFDPNLYGLKISKVLKSDSSVTNSSFTQYDRVEPLGDDFITGNLNDFYAIIDWKHLDINEAFDVDFAEAYKLSTNVGDYTSAPIIKQNLNIKETNSGKNQYLFGAGKNAIAGEYNLGVGKESMQSINDASYNLSIGYRSMKNHLSGAGNIAIGMDSLLNSQSVVDVTVVGWEAGKEMVSGVGDTAMGRRALAQAPIANQNTAFGDSTLWSLTPTVGGVGQGNVAFGYTAGEYGVTSTKSVMIGLAAARGSVGVDNSVLIGSEVMFSRATATTNNVVIGAFAMYNSTAGDGNIVIGASAGSNLNGNENLIIGRNAAASLTTGAGNIVIGDSAQSGASNVTLSLVIGYQAKATKSNQIVIGTDLQTEIVIMGVTFTKAQLEALKALV